MSDRGTNRWLILTATAALVLLLLLIGALVLDFNLRNQRNDYAVRLGRIQQTLSKLIANQPSPAPSVVAFNYYVLPSVDGTQAVMTVAKINNGSGSILHVLTIGHGFKSGVEYGVGFGHCVGATSVFDGTIANPIPNPQGQFAVDEDINIPTGGGVYWLRLTGPGHATFGGLRGLLGQRTLTVLAPSQPNCR